jgi:hypothetical protein
MECIVCKKKNITITSKDKNGGYFDGVYVKNKQKGD